MDTTPQPSSPSRYIAVTVFGLALLSSVGISGILPVLPLLAESFSISLLAAGSVIAAFALPGVILIPFYGIAADRFGRKRIVIPALLLFLVGGIGSFFSNNLHALLIFRGIQGAGAAPFGILYATIIADTWSGNQRTRMMGLTGMALGIGTGVSPAIGGIFGLLGWQWPFLLSLAALPVLWVACYAPLVFPQQISSLHLYTKNLKDSLQQRGTIPLLTLTICLFTILSGPIIVCFPAIATDIYKISPIGIGVLMSLSSLFSAAAASSITSLYPKYSARRLLVTGQGIYGISILLLTAFALLSNVFPALLGYGVLLFIPLACFGVGQGLSIPLSTTLLTGQAKENGRASLMALNAILMKSAQAAGPLLFGFLSLQLGIGYAVLFGLIPIILMSVILSKANLP